MKTYDFTFVYEVKNRELESVCLLAHELERRGYSVKIIETWHSIFHRPKQVKSRVTIGYALYAQNTLEHLKRYVYDCQKFLNMQWEQIFTNGDIDYDIAGKYSPIGVSGIACKACHLSWGEVNYNRLINKYGVAPQNARVVGHVALDFLRSEFNGYYLNREELLKQFNIPKDKKICLFISSFSYAFLPEGILENELYQNQSKDIGQFVKISRESQTKVLDWFEQLMIQNEEYVIIYRPHPAENDSPRLKDMAKKYSNFYVISELSVKQWILTCDKIYTWYSTAISEVYVAKKNCGILRPVPIPFNTEVEIYNQATFIEDYDSFYDSILNEKDFPIETENLNQYYYMDEDEPAYIKVCDYLEDIYNGDEYALDTQYKKPTSGFKLLAYNTYMNMLRFGWGRMIAKIVCPKRMKSFDWDEYQYMIKKSKSNYATDAEINEIKQRIADILKK